MKTTKDIANEILKNKQNVTDNEIKKQEDKVRALIRKMEIQPDGRAERNTKLYSLDKSAYIINELNKKNKLNQQLVTAQSLANNDYSNEDEQARISDIKITKNTNNLLKEKKTEFYLAAIASQSKYILDINSLRKDIESFQIWLELESYPTDPVPTKIQKIINKLENFTEYNIA